MFYHAAITNIFLRNQNFDICLAREVSSMFIGEKDFRTFMGSTRKDDVVTIRNIMEVDINPGDIMFNNKYIESYNHYNFWDITIKGRSFLYNQVRIFPLLILLFASVL